MTKQKKNQKKKLDLVALFKSFKRSTKIVIVVWTAFNLLFLALLLGAGASFFSALLFFLIWEVAILGYYVYRYHYKEIQKGGEWIDAIMFAVIAATVIRSLFIEAYQIPTSSMEKSLVVGDFLFVSKINYGARMPITPLSFPFAHHTMPFIGSKAYSEAVKLPYLRLPGFQKIKNGDVVVFNWPAETLGRPVDKKENYIKRCVGIPGDTLTVKDGSVYINGVHEKVPPFLEFEYIVKTNGAALPEKFYDRLDITDVKKHSDAIYQVQLIDQNVEAVKTGSGVVEVKRNINQPGENDGMLFPFNKQHAWSRDFYGPLIIPKKGMIITLDSSNFETYGRCIVEYENHSDFSMRNGKFFMGLDEITEYTFEMNYYFMMGDNRHMSYDSRYWGFVPENHIVGKALFVAFSFKFDVNQAVMDQTGQVVKPESKKFKGLRWKRTFMGIN